MHNLEISVIKAVAAVESGGKAFLNTGEPVILFEPHVFWRQLVARNINPKLYAANYADILYRVWKRDAYGPSTKQHERLNRAGTINREAALCAASWGRFQIMGYHYKTCGCHTIQDFINAMYKSEDEHLRLFMNFINATGLINALRQKDWAAFAKGYNGAAYKQNRYDQRLQNAYLSLRKITIQPNK